VGAKKNPIWRVVVADQRSPRDGRVIETIGRYNPQTQPSTVVIDSDRAQAWIDRGAQPTRAVAKLLRIALADASTAAAVAEAPAPDAPTALAEGEAPTADGEPVALGADAEAAPAEATASDA
jgi:small subunit ribosomal protein S16